MKTITQIFVVLIFAAVVVYDVIAIIKGGTESSISHLLIMWSYRYPLFPLCTGIVLGHLFWRMKPTQETSETIDKRF